MTPRTRYARSVDVGDGDHAALDGPAGGVRAAAALAEEGPRPGIAVHIGARRGGHVFRGVPGEWHLFAVDANRLALERRHD
jgi:hypothetical protein